MMNPGLQLAASSFLLMGLIACSQSSQNASSQPSTTTTSPTATPIESPNDNGDLTQLFSHIWRVTAAPSQPAPGSIYIFLANGTLLQTSCGEPYRISTWTIDKNAPRVLQVVEDGQLAMTASIIQLSNTTLQLQQTLVQNGEKREVSLAAVEAEFVCPDLPK